MIIGWLIHWRGDVKNRISKGTVETDLLPVLWGQRSSYFTPQNSQPLSSVLSHWSPDWNGNGNLDCFRSCYWIHVTFHYCYLNSLDSVRIPRLTETLYKTGCSTDSISGSHRLDSITRSWSWMTHVIQQVSSCHMGPNTIPWNEASADCRNRRVTMHVSLFLFVSLTSCFCLTTTGLRNTAGYRYRGSRFYIKEPFLQQPGEVQSWTTNIREFISSSAMHHSQWLHWAPLSLYYTESAESKQKHSRLEG